MAGEFVSSDLERAVGPLLADPGVVRLPHLPEREFWKAAAAVDACINLRYPAAGETSGIAIRLMGIGKPVLVTESEECARFPEDACLRVASGAAELDSLTAHMVLLTSMTEVARAIGLRGAAHIQAHHRVDAISRQYWELIVRLLYLITACAAALAASSQSAVRSLYVQIPMRDGVRLAANVFLPNTGGRAPVILERTPYGKGTAITPNFQALVNHGYAVVVQDVRGRYESEGIFDPLRQETADGDDTLNWIARQPWSNGKIGMTGGSYRGIVQWKAALTGNPHLKAIFPVVSGYDDYRDRFYSTGGAMKLGNRLLWMSENLKAPGYQPDFARYVLHLPLRTADIAATGWSTRMYREAAAHPSFDAFWRAISVKEQLERIKVPVFAVGGWYDNFAESDLAAYAALHKVNGLNRVLIGPWPHNMSYQFKGVDFGPDSAVPIRGTSDRVVRPVADGEGHAAGLAAAGEGFRHGIEPLARRV